MLCAGLKIYVFNAESIFLFNLGYSINKPDMMNLKHAVIIVIFFCTGAFFAGCDTMGQICSTFVFHTGADTLERGLDTLYAKHPEYKVPQDWEKFETLKPRPTKFT